MVLERLCKPSRFGSAAGRERYAPQDRLLVPLIGCHEDFQITLSFDTIKSSRTQRHFAAVSTAAQRGIRTCSQERELHLLSRVRSSRAAPMPKVPV